LQFFVLLPAIRMLMIFW